MNSDNNDELELDLWKEIASKHLSVSHDHWHVDRVLKFACELQKIYGGDWEVITAAVIMHDLGRSDSSHGEESIEKSVKQAKSILKNIGFPPQKTDQVLLAISEHDKPEIKPSTIEGKILKEADFLAGFGVWGILRIAMWAGETGGGIGQILDRLEYRMPKRLESLNFVESGIIARKEGLFTNLFLSLLQAPPQLPMSNWKGRYIVLEGISGSGKTTQACRLKEQMLQKGYEAILVNEPSDVYKDLRKTWEEKHHKQLEDPTIMKFLLMADRYQQMVEIVIPALSIGKFVISVRSFISTLVYQGRTTQDLAAIAFDHQFALIPDLLILYDIDEDIAVERINQREKKKGLFEDRALLEIHRKKYLELIGNSLYAKKVRVINSDASLDNVTERTLFEVESCFPKPDP